MRRKEKLLTDPAALDAIFERAQVCRLAFIDGCMPYIVPLNFGYDGKALYFHSALEGRKIDILRRNADVCFEVETDIEIVPGEEACNFGVRYSSIIGNGKAHFISDNMEKRHALDYIMKKYTNKTEWEYSDSELGRVAVFRVDIIEMSGKKSGEISG